MSFQSKEFSRREVIRTKLLESLPKGGVIAEIGVWEGAFSRRILEVCSPKVLHLIDPWLYLPEFTNTGFGHPKNEFLMEERYNRVRALFADDPRVVIHRATSEAALSQMPDHSLDWVYVDGNHNEPFINQDLELSLQKVKQDGVIAGDDYLWMNEALGAPVKRAVDSIVERLGRRAKLRLRGNQYRIGLKLPVERASAHP